MIIFNLHIFFQVSESIELFGQGVEALLIKYGRGIIDEQYLLTRLAQAGIEIYSMVTVLSRASRSIAQGAASAEHERLIVRVLCSQVRILKNYFL